MRANMMLPLLAEPRASPALRDVTKGLTARVKELPFLDGCYL